MSKPTTNYSPATKNTTPYGTPAKNTTGFADATKNRTSFAEVSKQSTGYGTGAPAETATSWRLDSIIVTLNSIVAYLNGYFTATAPNQLNGRATTNYAEI